MNPTSRYFGFIAPFLPHLGILLIAVFLGLLIGYNKANDVALYQVPVCAIAGPGKTKRTRANESKNQRIAAADFIGAP